MAKNFNFTSIKEVDIQAKKDSVDVESILANIDKTPLKWNDYDIYPGVKLPGVIDEYTDEQVIELKKCMHPTKGIFHSQNATSSPSHSNCFISRTAGRISSISATVPEISAWYRGVSVS